MTLEAGTLFFIVSDFLLRLISPGLFRFSKKRILGKYTGEKGRVQNEAIPDIVNFPAIGTFLSDSGKKPVFKDSQETGSHREKPVEPEENDKQKRFIIFSHQVKPCITVPDFRNKGFMDHPVRPEHVLPLRSSFPPSPFRKDEIPRRPERILDFKEDSPFGLFNQKVDQGHALGNRTSGTVKPLPGVRPGQVQNKIPFPDFYGDHRLSIARSMSRSKRLRRASEAGLRESPDKRGEDSVQILSSRSSRKKA